MTKEEIDSLMELCDKRLDARLGAILNKNKLKPTAFEIAYMGKYTGNMQIEHSTFRHALRQLDNTNGDFTYEGGTMLYGDRKLLSTGNDIRRGRYVELCHCDGSPFVTGYMKGRQPVSIRLPKTNGNNATIFFANESTVQIFLPYYSYNNGTYTVTDTFCAVNISKDGTAINTLAFEDVYPSTRFLAAPETTWIGAYNSRGGFKNETELINEEEAVTMLVSDTISTRLYGGINTYIELSTGMISFKYSDSTPLCINSNTVLIADPNTNELLAFDSELIGKLRNL